MGVGAGVGFNVNVPWRHEGMGDADCEAAPQRYSLYTLEGSSFVNITGLLLRRR